MLLLTIISISISTGTVTKLLRTTRNKKHNKVVMLARSKLKSIESKISEVLINNEISHEDFYDKGKKLSRIKRKN